MPIAWARSLGSRKVLVMIESVPGMSSAAPTPWSPRPATSAPIEGARAHANDPTVNTTNPVRNMRLRP